MGTSVLLIYGEHGLLNIREVGRGIRLGDIESEFPMATKLELLTLISPSRFFNRWVRKIGEPWKVDAQYAFPE